MTPAERKIRLNIFGLLLILALAAYSLFCLYVGTVTLTHFSKFNLPKPAPRRNNFSRVITGFSIFDPRPENVIKWSKVIGVPSYMKLSFKASGEDFGLFKTIGYIAFGCFVLASLLQSYVALRTLLQPSCAVGTKGAEISTYFSWSIVLRVISEIIFMFIIKNHFRSGMPWIINSFIFNSAWMQILETDDDGELVEWINMKPWQYDPKEKF